MAHDHHDDHRHGRHYVHGHYRETDDGKRVFVHGHYRKDPPSGEFQRRPMRRRRKGGYY